MAFGNFQITRAFYDTIHSIDTGTYDPIIVTNKTSGVAPFGVSFDLVESSTFSADNALMVSEFMWDFGDTGDDYNVGKGYCPAHVYRDSGTYVVTMSAYYYGVLQCTRQAIIEVSVDYSAFTDYYISADGSDSNDGLTEDTPFLTMTYAKTFYAENVRYLFRQGDTFSQSTTIQFGANGGDVKPGPVIFTSYEDANSPSDEKPIIYDTRDSTSSVGIFTMLNVDDFRLVGLKLQATGGDVDNRDTDATYPNGVTMSSLTPSNDVLILDCDVQGCGSTSLHPEGTHHILQDCTVRDGGSYGVYIDYGENCSYIGLSMKEFSNDSPEYTMRLSTCIVKNYVAYCDLWGDYTKCTLTVRGNGSSYNYVWNNHMDRFMGFNQTNDEEDETLHHNTFDANINVARDYDENTSGSYNTYGFFVSSNNTMVRNNVAYGFKHGFYINSHDIVGGASTVWYHNNTAIATDTDADFIRYQPDTEDLEIYNNVFYNTAITSSSGDRWQNIGGSTDTWEDFSPYEISVESDYNIFLGAGWNSVSYHTLIGIAYWDDDPKFTEWQADPYYEDINSYFEDALVGTTMDTDDVDGSLDAGLASLDSLSPAIGTANPTVVYSLFDFNNSERISKDMGAICSEVN